MNSGFIPRQLKIGFCLRDGGTESRWFMQRADEKTEIKVKLAYVSYYDEKGVFRKEYSFDGWRDKNVPVEEYANTPTDGFTIVKDRRGHFWSSFERRFDKMLISDPRGFLFEITPNNLMHIINCCDISKGGLINGKLVYGWSGANLILLPWTDPATQRAFDISERLYEKRYYMPSELERGKRYKDKRGNLYLCLGEHEIVDIDVKQNNWYYRDDLEKYEKNPKYKRLTKKFSPKLYDYYNAELYKVLYTLKIAKRKVMIPWTVENGKLKMCVNDVDFAQKSLNKRFVECVDEEELECADEIINWYTNNGAFSLFVDSRFVPMTVDETIEMIRQMNTGGKNSFDSSMRDGEWKYFYSPFRHENNVDAKYESERWAAKHGGVGLLPLHIVVTDMDGLEKGEAVINVKNRIDLETPTPLTLNEFYIRYSPYKAIHYSYAGMKNEEESNMCKVREALFESHENGFTEPSYFRVKKNLGED